MKANKRLRAYIETYLEENGNSTTHEIHDALKKRYPYHAPNINMLANILVKMKRVNKSGFYDSVGSVGAISRRVRACIWEFKEG